MYYMCTYPMIINITVMMSTINIIIIVTLIPDARPDVDVVTV